MSSHRSTAYSGQREVVVKVPLPAPDPAVVVPPGAAQEQKSKGRAPLGALDDLENKGRASRRDVASHNRPSSSKRGNVGSTSRSTSTRSSSSGAGSHRRKRPRSGRFHGNQPRSPVKPVSASVSTWVHSKDGDPGALRVYFSSKPWPRGQITANRKRLCPKIFRGAEIPRFMPANSIVGQTTAPSGVAMQSNLKESPDCVLDIECDENFLMEWPALEGGGSVALPLLV